jgi:hypothetical protein
MGIERDLTARTPREDVGGLIAEEGDSRRRLPERSAGLARDLGRGVLKPVEDPLDPGVDVLGGRTERVLRPQRETGGCVRP